MNKISETKKSKYNCSGAANAGNNKNKYSKHKKKDQKSNNKYINNNFPVKCTYCRQNGHFAIKCFKHPQGKSYKGKPKHLSSSKEGQFNDTNATKVEKLNN